MQEVENSKKSLVLDEKGPFAINRLDHVGIDVRDLDRSVAWYEEVLGLKKCQLEKWGISPTFMLAGKIGVALFPRQSEDQESTARCNQDLLAAQAHFERINVPYVFKDHFYYHSVYILDPDGHEFELTTLVIDEATLFNL